MVMTILAILLHRFHFPDRIPDRKSATIKKIRIRMMIIKAKIMVYLQLQIDIPFFVELVQELQHELMPVLSNLFGCFCVKQILQ